MNNFSFQLAESAAQFAEARRLFEAYAASLNFDLCFQGFAKELDTITEQYSAPTGALWLAYDGEKAIGCVGVREWGAATAELKRMYVEPAYRGQQVGAQLLEWSVASARQLGYQTLRLDTVETMEKAIALYRAFGFEEIAPYRENPLERVLYMEKKLL